MLRIHRVAGPLAAVILAYSAIGCDHDDDATDAPVAPDAGADTGETDAEVDATPDVPDVPDIPAPASSNPCDRIEPGPEGTREFPLDLSAAHASLRFFGTDVSHAGVDGALAAALEGDEPFAFAALQQYAENQSDVCALPATKSSLGPAKVTMVGDIAVITPGTGPVDIPSEATAAAIDVRSLPAAPGLREALASAASAVSSTTMRGPWVWVREHQGLVDEVYGPLMGIGSIYTSSKVNVAEPDIPGGAEVDLPLAVLTDADLAPEAARFAGHARMTGRAWLVGEDVLSWVAESQWWGVGTGGLVYRNRLLGKALTWPDVIPADLRTTEPIARVAALLRDSTLTPLAGGKVTRATFEPIPTGLQIQPEGQSLGTGRAALLVGHGATRMFFPYFATVGDTLDEGLLAELDALEASTASGLGRIMPPVMRLATHLRDSHANVGFFGNYAGTAGGYLPLMLDTTEQGDAVVRISELPTILPGDVIESMNGTSVESSIDKMKPLIPASTPGALLRDAFSSILYVHDDTELQLRAPDGTVRTEVVPFTNLANGPIAAVSTRGAGPLDDLGAPDLYYINLDAGSYTGTPKSAQLIEEAQSAAGLVIDGRGYPGTFETWVLVRRILTEATSVRFRTPFVTPYGTTFDEVAQVWDVATPGFSGPVAVLIGPWTQSQAEHILMGLVSTNRAQFVGRQTAGVNGNVTGVMIPGALGMLFTGMEVLFDDGSVFHGRGILPNIEVYPTQSGLAAGEDPELMAAIAALRNTE